MKKKEDKRGGKSKEFIVQENKELILRLATSGSTIEEILKALGLSRASFYSYLKKDPELKHSIDRAKVKADAKVEDSLYKRATGYDIIEENIEYFPSGDTGKPVVKSIKRVKKHVPGDTTAQIFWLKNRQSHKWRDRQEHDVKVTDLTKIAEEFDKVIGA